MNELIKNKAHYNVKIGDNILEVVDSSKEALFALYDLHNQFISEEDYYLSLMNESKYIDLLVKYLYGVANKGHLKLLDLDDFLKRAGGYELFQIVDADDNPLYYRNGLPVVEFRKNCHGFGEYNRERNNFHRSTLFLILNAKDEILLSQRSISKDTYPGYWEIGGGHNGIIDTYEQTLFKEIQEELSIESKDYSYKDIGKYRLIQSDNDNGQSQIMKLFAVKLNKGINIKINKEEVSAYKFFPINRLIELIIKNEIQIVPHQKSLLIDFFKLNGIYLEYLNMATNDGKTILSKIE